MQPPERANMLNMLPGAFYRQGHSECCSFVYYAFDLNPAGHYFNKFFDYCKAKPQTLGICFGPSVKTVEYQRNLVFRYSPACVPYLNKKHFSFGSVVNTYTAFFRELQGIGDYVSCYPFKFFNIRGNKKAVCP